ncbi:MAG: ROK family transcriptional regulator [Verrucomicrobia bacterium]|nr:ROK family transcriptional regulator [Verrucomicrobiota bacterium]
MQIATKTNQQIGAFWNRRLVLQLLRKHGQLSRRQLADMTGLQGSTLTYIVRELLDQKILRTAGKAPSTRVGQKQILLEIDSHYGWSLGVDLRKERALVLMQDVAGRILDRYEVDLGDDLPTTVKALKGSLDARLASHVKLAGRFLGVGVGVPGAVNPEQGIVLISKLYNTTDYPLRNSLRDAFDVRAHIDHNANLAALAESRLGSAGAFNNFIYFLLHHGANRTNRSFDAFGSSLFIEGKIFHGAHFAAGELDTAIAPPPEQMAAIVNLESLELEDGDLSPALLEMADALGKSMAHLINLLDPESVVIGADITIRNKQFLGRLAQNANRFALPIHERSIRIVPGELGSDAVAIGAAVAVAERALWGGESMTDTEAAVSRSA